MTTAGERLADDTRVECRICWYEYDPAAGDDIAQIAPGTPFAELPPHWRCPQCDAEQAQFLAVQE
jgi:rubredoxin